MENNIHDTDKCLYLYRILRNHSVENTIQEFKFKMFKVYVKIDSFTE